MIKKFSEEEPGFNPYFVGDEFVRLYHEQIKQKELSFNPYFVGDEFVRDCRASDTPKRRVVSILILLEMSL